ncbi:MAG: hypothetical protein HOF43_07240 [Chloroflexi bacterium]|jgi:hypothetical protein|nr:hypothetical protein [Chloroflexota bacterium]
MTKELQTLIEQYRSTWERIVRETGNVDEVNQFFHLPCIFLGADGTASLFNNAEDISTFHRPRLELFQKNGVKNPKAKDFKIVSLGKHSALVSVTWEQCREDDSIAMAWHHSYNAVKTDAGWRILLSTFEADA